ncbi:MAG: ImmA/IrrE family metallo-endopeptidase [Parcubacteria group bacterium]|nr:ImmA/IrrE family metallo-endopeptidase [Parcubacteria group bacterium]
MKPNDYESVANNILKPQIKTAKLKAVNFWKDLCGKKIPVHLNDIIQKLGINVKEANLSIDGHTKMDNNGVCCILYNKNVSVVRQRFTVAHEIGHIALEHTSFLGDCNQYSNKSQEKEADAFAGELLVPSSDLKDFVNQKMCSIQDIVDRYWISRDVAFVAIQNNRLLNKIES